MMRPLSLLAFSLSLLMVSYAQESDSGHLIVAAPSNPLTCEMTTVDWVWTGSASDAEVNTVSVAVVQVTSSNDRRRSLAEPSPIRFIRKRVDSKASLHARDNAINIAGGSSLPMSSGSWTWNSVGVTPGTYRMALTVDGKGVTVYSDTFVVSQGPDTSCLGSLASSSTSTSTQAPSSTSSAASETATESSTSASNEANNTTSIPAAATNPSSFTTPEDQGNNAASSQGHKGLSSGSIAAAVVVPLLAVGVLLWLLCMRRKNQESQEKTTKAWSEKFTGLFAGSSSHGQGHRRQISGPMDPVHAAGLAVHDQSVQNQMRQVGGENATHSGLVTKAPEHWVDFHPDAQEMDARLVTPQRVDEMVRASMDDQARLYMQGTNASLGQSSDRHLTLETESDGSLPSYLRDADFTSRHTHSSFGHEPNGLPVESGAEVTLERSSTQKSSQLSRSESKVRRKPVPVYSTSTIGDNREASASSSSLEGTSDGESHGPFSDTHEVTTDVAKEHLSASTVVIEDEKLQTMLASGDQEFLTDSPTLPQELRTPVNVSRSFPVSVHSTFGDSPTQRILLETPRQSLTEEQKKELYKLSIQLPQEDRGFRVSF